MLKAIVNLLKFSLPKLCVCVCVCVCARACMRVCVASSWTFVSTSPQRFVCTLHNYLILLKNKCASYD